MKYSTALATAAMVGSTLAGGRDGAFAVMRFNGKEICKGRMDPIVSPNTASSHVHSIFGGSNFGISATGESLSKSKCTSAKVKGDKSAYWTPTVFFHDEKAGTFEPVPVMYTNVYYFMEATDDKIEAFPLGLSMVSGDAMTRVLPPGGGQQNLDPANGPINAALWTCPRKNPESPRSWPVDSDGSEAGVGDKVNLGQGAGFPSCDCDQTYSPLRADIHFPSCYKKDADVTDYKNNMAWPTSKGASKPGRLNCPEGYMHVPHIFMEVYWQTDKYRDKWSSNSGTQPFVLSNGDVTGFSIHADFMSGWDTGVLQNIIDNCNTGHDGMHACPGIAGTDQVNDEECSCEGELITEDDFSATSMSKLPGNNLLAGWKYGLANTPKYDSAPAAPMTPPKSSPAAQAAPPSPPKSEPAPPKSEPSPYVEHQKPKDTPAPAPASNPVPAKEPEKQPEAQYEAQPAAPPPAAPAAPAAPEQPSQPEAEAVSAPETTPAPLANANDRSGGGGACKVKTVYETTTITIDEAAPSPPPARMARRHAHSHRHHARAHRHS